VAVTRSGGFAGLVRRAEADSADHPAMTGLLEEIRLDDLPDFERLPDRYVYDIDIGERRVRVSEPELGGPLRELVELVMPGA
jgi:hypothetical protein